MYKKDFIPSVNFHLWEPCNMKCKFCFAKFQDVKNTILPKGHLTKEKAIKIISVLASYGFKKISFAGGEPTLCPWLPELFSEAKDKGMTTMLITNGTNLTQEFLDVNKSNLDWISISIDSLCDKINQLEGRTKNGGNAISEIDYTKIIENINKIGYRLKINTVVHQLNYHEDMRDFILKAKPRRWKIMQVLPIIGQNDRGFNQWEISSSQFQKFRNKHKHIDDIITEDNSEMKNSYVMIDPAGRFFDNSRGKHTYSKPLLEVGVGNSIKQVDYNYESFIKRGGIYDW